MDKAAFEDYYTYHLNYFQSSGQGTEKEFLSHVWHIVQKRIEHFDRKNPFSSEHPLHQSNIAKPTAFQQYLATRDQWNIRPNGVLVKEKDGKIAELEAHIQDLEEQVKAHSKYSVSQQVYVEEGYLPTLIELVQQLRELELPNGRKLLKSDHHRYCDTANPYNKPHYDNSCNTATLMDLLHTRPWMHNGLFDNLKGVINLYNSGMHQLDGRVSPAVDSLYPYTDPLLKPLHLTNQEKEELIAFLEALNPAEYKMSRPVLPGYE